VFLNLKLNPAAFARLTAGGQNYCLNSLVFSIKPKRFTYPLVINLAG